MEGANVKAETVQDGINILEAAVSSSLFPRFKSERSLGKAVSFLRRWGRAALPVLRLYVRQGCSWRKLSVLASIFLETEVIKHSDGKSNGRSSWSLQDLLAIHALFRSACMKHIEHANGDTRRISQTILRDAVRLHAGDVDVCCTPGVLAVLCGFATCMQEVGDGYRHGGRNRDISHWDWLHVAVRRAYLLLMENWPPSSSWVITAIASLSVFSFSKALDCGATVILRKELEPRNVLNGLHTMSVPNGEALGICEIKGVAYGTLSRDATKVCLDELSNVLVNRKEQRALSIMYICGAVRVCASAFVPTPTQKDRVNVHVKMIEVLRNALRSCESGTKLVWKRELLGALERACASIGQRLVKNGISLETELRITEIAEYTVLEKNVNSKNDNDGIDGTVAFRVLYYALRAFDELEPEEEVHDQQIAGKIEQQWIRIEKGLERVCCNDDVASDKTQVSTRNGIAAAARACVYALVRIRRQWTGSRAGVTLPGKLLQFSLKQGLIGGCARVCDAATASGRTEILEDLIRVLQAEVDTKRARWEVATALLFRLIGGCALDVLPYALREIGRVLREATRKAETKGDEESENDGDRKIREKSVALAAYAVSKFDVARKAVCLRWLVEEFGEDLRVAGSSTDGKRKRKTQENAKMIRARL